MADSLYKFQLDAQLFLWPQHRPNKEPGYSSHSNTRSFICMVVTQYIALGILGSMSHEMTVNKTRKQTVKYRMSIQLEEPNKKPRKLEGRVFTWSQYSDVASRWRASRGKRFLSSPKCPDCSLHPVYFTAGIWHFFLGSKLTGVLDLHLVPRLRIHGSIPPYLAVPSWYDNIWTTLRLVVVILSHK